MDPPVKPEDDGGGLGEGDPMGEAAAILWERRRPPLRIGSGMLVTRVNFP